MVFCWFNTKFMTSNNIFKNTGKALVQIIYIALAVLLAFMVDRWDENRKDTQIALHQIRDIKEDLKTGTAHFKTGIDMLKGRSMILEYILENAPGNLDSVPTSYIAKSLIAPNISIEITDQSYKRLKDTKYFHIEKYEAYFQKVNEYYSGYSTYNDQNNEWLKKIYNDSYFHIIHQNEFEIMIEDSVDVYIQQDSNDLRNSLLKYIEERETRNILRMNLSAIKFMLEIYQKVYDGAKIMLEKTEELLDEA